MPADGWNGEQDRSVRRGREWETGRQRTDCEGDAYLRPEQVCRTPFIKWVKAVQEGEDWTEKSGRKRWLRNVLTGLHELRFHSHAKDRPYVCVCFEWLSVLSVHFHTKQRKIRTTNRRIGFNNKERIFTCLFLSLSPFFLVMFMHSIFNLLFALPSFSSVDHLMDPIHFVSFSPCLFDHN